MPIMGFSLFERMGFGPENARAEAVSADASSDVISRPSRGKVELFERFGARPAPVA